MANQIQSQTERITKHLLSGGTLTPLQALKKFDCWALSSRISNIKSLGLYKIKSELIVVKGSKKRVSKYSIEI